MKHNGIASAETYGQYLAVVRYIITAKKAKVNIETQMESGAKL